MSFFSSLFGGNNEKQVQTNQSGFGLLPPELQNAFKQYGTQLTSAFPGTTPTFNADQTQAFNMARQGTAPTPQSFQQDLSMLTNPFDENVINAINREAQGQNSLVNQAATQAGQQGSNRSFLGTSDVEQNRLNNIGQFRQSQYNNAVNQILGPLAGLKQQDITNLMNVGQQEQDLPFQNLMRFAQLLGAVPQSGGSTQTGSTKSSTTPGLLSFF